MKKIKLLYLIRSLTSGGAEKQLVELVNSIDKSIIEPHIIIHKKEIHYDILNNNQIKLKIIEKDKKISFKYYLEVLDYIKNNDIDIIHSFMVNTNFHGKILSLLSHKKLVCSIRNSKYKLPWILLEWMTAWIPSIYLFNSHTAKKEFIRYLPIFKNKFKTIHNSIDLRKNNQYKQLDAKKIRKELGVKENNYFIINVGRITEQKNQLCFLKAIKQAKDKLPLVSFKAVLIGKVSSEKYLKEIKRYISLNNLSDLVSIIEPTKEIYKYYLSCNILVLSSSYEGFPNVIMEAIALNKPVIASNVSDIEYLIKDGENGFIFEDNDDIGLSTRIIKSIDQDFKDSGKIILNFDSKIIQGEYIKVYKEVMIPR